MRKRLAEQEKSITDYRASVEPAFQKWVKEQTAAAVAGSLDKLPGDPLLHFALDEGKATPSKIKSMRNAPARLRENHSGSQRGSVKD